MDSSLRAAGSFAPTIQIETSTTRATAHPDARITIENSSSDNLKNLTIDMPDGFWGSLAAVTPCTEAQLNGSGCPSSSRIGRVSTEASVVEGSDESDVKLDGDIFLTEALGANAATDPAGISIVVDPKVGSVQFDKIIVNSRVAVRTADLGPTPPTGAVGEVLGVRTIVTDLPKSATDSVHSRTVVFHVDRVTVDLISDVDGPNPALLTNPSRCGNAPISASFTSYESATPISDTDDYVVDDCGTVKFDPSISMQLSDNTVSTETGLTANISLDDDSASFNSIVTKLPTVLGANYPAFGAAADRCSGGTAFGSSPIKFAPASCPAHAKVGLVTITTPSLPNPVVGDVYLINKTPLPWLGIDVSPSTDIGDPKYGNPKGVQIRMVGVTDIDDLDPSCVDPGFTGSCQPQITARFDDLPDAPVTSIALDLDRPDRVDPTPTPHTVSSKIIVVGDPGENCQPKDDFAIDTTSNADTATKVPEVIYQDFTGCDPIPMDFTSNVPTGTAGSGHTSDTTPDFNLTYSGVLALQCAVDDEYTTSAACSTPNYAFSGSPLGSGTHYVYAREFNTGVPTAVGLHRAFAVDPASGSADTTAPAVDLTVGPGVPGPGEGTTSDTTPQFTFEADEAASFECSLDGGSFLPCGSAAADTPTSFDWPADAALIPHDSDGAAYTFAVRARDAAGNVDFTPESASFRVNVPFAPVIDVSTTTLQARAHPNLTLTISNLSHKDLKDLTVRMPDGFLGGLTGVQSLCPIASADAGACAAASKVGSVSTEAIVDDSTVRISGDVFLTEARESGDPAGLSVKIAPKIQSIVFNDVIVNARLVVRGQAQGVDAITTNLPNTVTNALDGPTSFDLRKMTMKIGTGAGAPYPLLTNPSSCTPTPFIATFASHSAVPTATDAENYEVTGCDALPFAPAITTNIVKQGTTEPPAARKDPVLLTATVSASPGDSAIQSTQVTLPKPVSIDVVSLGPVCEQAEYEGEGCPSNTIIGSASAVSPLLPEPLEGKVYMLRGIGKVIPRILVALRGRIDVDVIAINEFVNGSQIRSTFNSLPDVPMSSFTLSIGSMLSIGYDPCTTNDRTMTGAFTAFNGKQAAIANTLSIGCASLSYKIAWKQRGSRSTLKLQARGVDGQKPLKRAVVKLPRGIKFRKNATKRILVRANGKRLPSRCLKTKKSSLYVSFCNKPAQVTSFDVYMRSGSISAPRKRIRRPILTVDSYLLDGSKSTSEKIDLSRRDMRKGFVSP